MLVPLGGHLARLVSCNVLRKVGFEIEARSEMIGKATLAPSACSLSPQPLQNRHSRTTHSNHERIVRVDAEVITGPARVKLSLCYSAGAITRRLLAKYFPRPARRDALKTQDFSSCTSHHCVDRLPSDVAVAGDESDLPG